MANYLRQATAASVILGPFLDDTDGRSAETSLAIVGASIYVSKRGTASSAINSSSPASHMAFGYYTVALNATDTGSAGDLLLFSSPSGALPVWREFNVMAPSAYDSLVLGASTLPTSIIVGGIPVGAFAASSITATAFAGSAIGAPVIGSSVILPTTIKTGAIVADTIAACAFTNTKFAGSAINATNFAACAIIPTVMGASVITLQTIAGSAINSTNFAATAGSVVWNNAVRTITGGSVVATSGSVIATNTLALAASSITNAVFTDGAASAVWNAAVRSLTDKAGFTSAMGACAISASNISDGAITSTILAASAITNANFAVSAGSQIWDAAVRTVTGGSVVATSGSVVATSVLDKTGYVLGASSIGASTIAASALYNTAIAASAINNTNFALTAASQVWDAAVRTVTGGSVVATSGSVVTTSNLDKTGYVLGASSISGSTIAASTIDRGTFSLTAASQVWDAAVRVVTGGSVVATSGSVVTTNVLDKTGYVLGPSSISGSTIAGSTIDSSIFSLTAASQVWDAAVRSITAGSVVATSGSVTTVSNLDKTNYTIAASGITNATLTDAALDAILDEPIEGALTMRQAMRIFMATLAGKSASTGAGTVAFRNLADDGDRVAASMNSGGYRTAVIITAS